MSQMSASKIVDEIMASGSLRVSASGKVLLTGGYLILEEQFAGLVLATSARFYTTISRRRVEGVAVSAATIGRGEVLQLRVESPQFNQIIVAHAIRLENGRLDIRLCDPSDRNVYVEETLLCALNGVAGLAPIAFSSVCDSMRANGEELHIRLDADNAFYSQVARLQQSGKPFVRSSLQELPAFLPPIIDADAATGKTSIAKTGLGSSAALVTSLVGAITEFFLRTASDSDGTEAARLDLIHNLAQLSHCFVQRKIGSGFDVSAASYGTQRYARFSPSLLNDFTTGDHLVPALIADCIRNQTQWKRSERVQPFSIPQNFRLLMGDVSTGSATVSMVRQVLQWQKANPTASTRVVTSLAAANAAVERSFKTLAALQTADAPAFERACAELATKNAETWKDVDESIGDALVELQKHYNEVRRFFREMGELAGVPLEPREHTALIDATLAIPGVLIAGVPGAGGYDALFVLTLDDTTLDRVETLWLGWAVSHPDTMYVPTPLPLDV